MRLDAYGPWVRIVGGAGGGRALRALVLELGGMGVKGGVRSMGSFDVWLEWWMVISPLFLWGLEGDVIHLSKNSPHSLVRLIRTS